MTLAHSLPLTAVRRLDAPPSGSNHPLAATGLTGDLTAAGIKPLLIEGCVQVFTCSYRNFFAAVMAEALRCAGQGTMVLVVQFLKGGVGQGPGSPVRLGQNLDWLRCGLPYCLEAAPQTSGEQQAIAALWQYTQTQVSEGVYDLVVLDELSLAIQFGAIPEAAVLQFLDERPRYVDVILTGPQMPGSLLERASQVTEIKHRFRG